MRKYLYKFNEDIENIDYMLAHLSENGNKKHETLMEHSNLVFDKVLMFNRHNDFIAYVRQLINDIVEEVELYKCNENVADIIFKLFLNAIYMHDAGKSSLGFQCGPMKNEFFEKDKTARLSENHSPFSSRMFMDYACNELSQKQFLDSKPLNPYGYSFLLYIIFSFSYCIQKHHSSLVSISSFMDSMKEILMEENESEDLVFKPASNCPELKYYKNVNNSSKFILKLDINEIKLNKIISKVSRELFLLNKILYSTLVAADSIATSEYMNDSSFELKSLNIESLMNKYRDSGIYKNIQEHFKSNIFDGTINSVRCDIFKETDANMSKHIDKNIFYLESPTGSGKTNTSMNIAFRAVELSKETDRPLGRIIYTAPFNTITTQTTDFLNKIFDDTNIVDIAEVNSSTEIKVGKTTEDKKEQYDLSLLDYQMINYPITLTSHVKLFSVLFGNGRVDSLSLIHLFNSVIVIDEIQAYKIDVWYKMISFLDVYAKYMNIKFVIMSATLPKIGSLIDKDKVKSNYCDLIVDSSIYFKSKYFRNRISKYNFEMLSNEFLEQKSLLDEEEYKILCFDKILSKIRKIYEEDEEAKILVEFIKKKTCREFYKYIKECNAQYTIKDEDLYIKEVTSDDNSYFKKRTIDLVKSSKSIIIVSTQCIEAGVDINMDYGFKDISYIDNEEQFLGRIRREYDESKYSEAIFFNLDNEDDIYSRNSFNFKKGLNLMNEEYREIIETKNFSFMFDDLLDYINKCLNSLNDKVTKANFENHLSKLDYKAIYKELELIEKKEEYSLYIPFDIEIVDEDGNKKIYSGKEVWKSFLKATKEDDYAKRKVLMSKSMSKMSLFTYKYLNQSLKCDFGTYLESKGINYFCIKNIYYLDLAKEDIDKFVDDEYKFDKDKFENFDLDRFI